MPRTMSDAVIPRLFSGERSRVVKATRSFVSSARKKMEWNSEGLEAFHIGEIAGDIIVDRPLIWDYPSGIYVDKVLENLCTACRSDDRALWFRNQFSMTIRGLEYFWFMLSCLRPGSLLIQCATVSPEERSQCFTEIAKKVAAWWDVLLEVDARIVMGVPYHRGWSHWRTNIVGVLLECGGMTEDEINSDPSTVTMEYVAERIRRYLP